MAGVESPMKCMVCNESDGARHYGSICCRYDWLQGILPTNRSLQARLECPYGRKCVIEKEYRNCCRACRYDKCIQVGLNPMLVHGDRGYARSRLQELPDNLDGQLVKVKTEVPSADYLTPKTEVEDSVPKPHPVDLGTDTFNEVLLQTSRIRMVDLDELPLGVKHAIPRYSPNDVRSIAKYFIFAERLSDSFGQCSDDLHKYNIDVPASVAFRKPGAICPRVPVDWRPSKVSTSANFRKNYLRIIAHFFDWASHIPELELLSENDKELLVLSRCIPCSWLLLGHRTAIYDADGIVVTSGDYFPENGKDIMDAELHALTVPCDAAMTDIVRPLKKLDISEAEYALLRVVCFCVPVSGMSQEGTDLILAAKEKYLSAFSDLIRMSLPDSSFTQVVQRISRLLVLLSATERVAQLDDNTLSMMSLFNYAELQGSLTWDLHVKKNVL